MALHCICDGGCGATSPDAEGFEELGLVIKRQYCTNCAPAAHAYLKARDEAHDKAAAVFQKAHEQAVKRHAKDGLKLPDHHRG